MRKFALWMLFLCFYSGFLYSLTLNEKILSKTWYENGKIHFEKRDFKKSVECLEKSIMLNPDNVESQVLLNRVLNIAVKKVKAKQNKSVQKEPEFSISREPKKNYLTGNTALSMQGDLIREARKKGRFTLLDSYLSKSKPKVKADINETIDKTNAKINDNMIEELHLKGMEYAKKQDFKMAIEQFNRILEIDNSNVSAMSNLGLALAYNDQLYDAVKIYKKIMELSPVNTKYYKQAKQMVDRIKGFM